MRANNYPLIAIVLTFVFACSEDAVPQLGAPCAGQTDCFAGDRLSCIDGVCLVKTCRSTSTCPTGAACVDGACGPAQCANNTECAENERCWEGACRGDLCDSAQSCDDGEVCRGKPPLCQSPPEICTTDRDCLAGSACDDRTQKCTPPCQTSDDCVGTDVCRQGFCSVPCISSNDCNAADLCFNGECVTSSCEDTSCVNEVNPLTCVCVDCFNDSQCGFDQGCNDVGVCVGCTERRETSEQCEALGLFFSSGCCSECQTDAHCPGRLICSSGVCSEPSSVDCIRDTDCDMGQSCDGGLCVDLGSNQTCRSQTECPDDEACYPDARCHPESSVCESCDFRCVASSTDDLGSCVGCTLDCDPTGCPVGTTCVVQDNATEGACINTVFSTCP